MKGNKLSSALNFDSRKIVVNFPMMSGMVVKILLSVTMIKSKMLVRLKSDCVIFSVGCVICMRYIPYLLLGRYWIGLQFDDKWSPRPEAVICLVFLLVPVDRISFMPKRHGASLRSVDQDVGEPIHQKSEVRFKLKRGTSPLLPWNSASSNQQINIPYTYVARYAVQKHWIVYLFSGRWALLPEAGLDLINDGLHIWSV